MHRILPAPLLLGALLASLPAVAGYVPGGGGSCYYNEASGSFSAQGADARAGASGTLRDSEQLRDAASITIDGLRYAKAGEGNETLATLAEYVVHGGMIADVRYFRARQDPYNEYVFLPRDARSCSWVTYRYEPDLHFAWIEEKMALVDEFLFKYPALAVDPASFRRQGEYLRGIGFDFLGHPHKQEDGSQPRYNRSWLEADCKGKRVRLIDQRSYAANRELVAVSGGSEKWFAVEDVYPALAMLSHAMCEVPGEHWNEKTRLPTTLDEFSDYVHAAAHGKVE